MNRNVCWAVVAAWDFAAAINLLYGYFDAAIFWASLALALWIALRLTAVKGSGQW